MKIYTSYAHIRKGTDCTILSEGKDWYSVRSRGSVVYVPKWAFIPTKEREVEEEEDNFESKEDYMNMEY